MNKKTLLILFIGVILTLSLVRNLVAIFSADRRIADAADRLTAIKEKNEQIKIQLEEVESSEFKEKQARDKLGLAREGEVMLVLPPEDLVKRLSPIFQDKAQVEANTPNWKKWANLFF